MLKIEAKFPQTKDDPNAYKPKVNDHNFREATTLTHPKRKACMPPPISLSLFSINQGFNKNLLGITKDFCKVCNEG